ncbi:MAG: GNAT family N-acetyltransferase [Chlamydiales bacterium]|nr:GNAT family N-acetyltransferase [Chlamydiales bacterium]
MAYQQNEYSMQFQALNESHEVFLLEWLNAPHVKEAYGNEHYSLQDVKEIFFSLSTNNQGYIAFFKEEPIGYIRMYEIDHSHAYGKYWDPKRSTVGIELFIGGTDFLHKKLGIDMLNTFIQLHATKIERIIIDPLLSNERGISFCRNYGFREIDTIQSNGQYRLIFDIKIRGAVRGVIFNQEGKILLIRFKADPCKADQKDMDSFWITPGGKVEKNETYEEALSREIQEETGLISYQIKQSLFVDIKATAWHGDPIRIFNQFYVVEVLDDNKVEVKLEDYEKEFILEYKWWDIEEMATTFETIFPKQLLEQVQTYLAISS